MEQLEIGNTYKYDVSDGASKEGIFVSETEDSIFVKLDSGYNIGIEKNNIEDVELLDEKRASDTSQSKNISDPDILILHTGGTIASRVDYSTGAVSSQFSPDDLLEMFPDLDSFGTIDSQLISNMPSDDMNFSHYNKMGEAIEDAVKNKPSLKGIILTHGTDTLHYTSAALSFSLENIPIPVVVTGSQRSSDRPSSDAHENLLNAAYSIERLSDLGKGGVYACLHRNSEDKSCALFNGVNLRKNHTSRRDAFKQINQDKRARLDHERDMFEFVTEPDTPNGEFTHRKFDTEKQVGIIRARPGLTRAELEPYKEFDAMLLEGTGLGHMPINKFDENTAENEKIFNFITDQARNKPVAITSQTINGRINLNVYTPGRKLKNNGVLGHLTDMTTETAYVKLHWLISTFSDEKARTKYAENLRGEITPRTTYNQS